MNTRISGLIRTSLEDLQQVELGDVPTEQILQEVVLENQQPTAVNMVKDFNEANTALEVISEVETLAASGDEVALESAAYGLSVLNRCYGLGSGVASLESIQGSGVSDLGDQILVAAVESLAKELQVQMKKYDTDREQIAKTRALLNRVRKEVSRYEEEYNTQGVRVNLERVLSFFSREFEPVTDVAQAMREELQNLETINKVLHKGRDRFAKMVKDATALPNTREGALEFTNMLATFDLTEEINELSQLRLLNSGVITGVVNESHAGSYAELDYHQIKDGSNLSRGQWIKTGIAAAISGALLLSGRGLFTILGGAIGITTATKAYNAYLQAQGKNTEIFQSFDDVREFIDGVEKLLDLTLKDNRLANEVQSSVNALMNKVTLFTRAQQGSDWSETGKAAVRGIGAGLIKHYTGADVDLGGINHEDATQADLVVSCHLNFLSLIEIRDLHTLVCGAFATGFLSNIVKELK